MPARRHERPFSELHLALGTAGMGAKRMSDLGRERNDGFPAYPSVSQLLVLDVELPQWVTRPEATSRDRSKVSRQPPG